MTVIFIIICSLTGCAYNAGEIQKAERSYLQFSGNPDGVNIIIDNNESFKLSTNMETLYQVKKGKHHLKIYRNEKLIVDRVIFISDQGTMEIILP